MNSQNRLDSPIDLKDAVTQWAERIGVKVREIHLREMRQKWASISTNGRLTLNTELLNLPEPLTEFVIVHELVHLLVPNHGKLFKGYMSAYLPDWVERQKHLKILNDADVSDAVKT
ncbi:MAG: M48 family metallopeptidase [Candidatus Poribacteria bacterium]|nr:M48 family metallopeptidase [Candidatus Poribacteria bacterium]